MRVRQSACAGPAGPSRATALAMSSSAFSDGPSAGSEDDEYGGAAMDDGAAGPADESRPEYKVRFRRAARADAR